MSAEDDYQDDAEDDFLSDPEDEYLDELDARGVRYSSVSDVISQGYQLCRIVRTGATSNEIARDFGTLLGH